MAEESDQGWGVATPTLSKSFSVSVEAGAWGLDGTQIGGQQERLGTG